MKKFFLIKSLIMIISLSFLLINTFPFMLKCQKLISGMNIFNKDFITNFKNEFLYEEIIQSKNCNDICAYNCLKNSSYEILYRLCLKECNCKYIEYDSKYKTWPYFSRTNLFSSITISFIILLISYLINSKNQFRNNKKYENIYDSEGKFDQYMIPLLK